MRGEQLQEGDELSHVVVEPAVAAVQPPGAQLAPGGEAPRLAPQGRDVPAGQAALRAQFQQRVRLRLRLEVRRRLRALRLLAIAERFDPGVPTVWLWQSVLDAPDAEHLTERLIALAYATREAPWPFPGDEIEDWAVPLRDWLRARPYPPPQQTGRVLDVALRHLPDWPDRIDADTAEALSELAGARDGSALTACRA